MLGFYLSTVVIWMIIIYCAIFMCKDKINEKIITTGIEKKKANFFSMIVSLFVMSAIPVVRLIILITIIYMAGCSQEEFEELTNKSKKDNNGGQTV